MDNLTYTKINDLLNYLETRIIEPDECLMIGVQLDTIGLEGIKGDSRIQFPFNFKLYNQ